MIKMESSKGTHFTQNESILKGLLMGDDKSWEIVTKQGLKDVKRSMKRYEVTSQDAEDILQNAMIGFFKALKKNEGAIDNLIHFAANVWRKRVKAATLKVLEKEIKDREAHLQSEVIEHENEDEAGLTSLYDTYSHERNCGNKDMDTIIDTVVEEFLLDYAAENKKIFRDHMNGDTFVQTANELQMSVDTIKSRYRKMKQQFQSFYNNHAN